jgi:pimeloyl-ACP methyl ester carboxylesterase
MNENNFSNFPPLPETQYARIPIAAQHRYEGDRFSYLETKPFSAKSGVDSPVIVMLHGIGANASYFRFQLAALGQYFRVIAWNAPGYGFSDVMVTKAPSDKDYAVALADFADSLSLTKFALTGNSFGSAVAQAFAIHFPEKVVCMLLSGVGVGQKKLSVPREDAFKGRVANLKKGGYQYADGGVDHLVAANTSQAIKALMIHISRGLLQPGLERAVAFRLSSFFSPDHVEKMVMPILLIQGSEDTTNPRVENADLLVAAKPNIDFQEWLGVGHLPEIEASERFNDALKCFVERYYPEGRG